jgi:hypothetical protein
MKHTKILFIIPLMLVLSAFDSCSKDNSQSDADAKKAAQQKAAHDAFVGDSPKPQPAYNITDYTNNPPHSNSQPKQ